QRFVRRALLKVDGEQRKTVSVRPGLRVPAGEIEKLQNLEPVLGAIAVVSHNRVEEIDLGRIHPWIGGEGNKRWNGPAVNVLDLLRIEQGTEDFGSPSNVKSQAEVTEYWTSFNVRVPIQ